MFIASVNIFADETFTQVSQTETLIFRNQGDAVASFIMSWAKVGPVGYRNDTGELYVDDKSTGRKIAAGTLKPVQIVEGARHL